MLSVNQDQLKDSGGCVMLPMPYRTEINNELSDKRGVFHYPTSCRACAIEVCGT